VYRVTVDVTDGNGGSATAFVDVTVNPSGTPVNLARSATATASSENTGRDQTAAKDIDGFVDGYPTDSTREWAAPGQLAGAWIPLTWTSARAVSRVIRHDRINIEDQILGGILRFSDGTTIAVGTLPNDGASRGWSTGLAKFEVY
jgi:hypothetical protein